LRTHHPEPVPDRVGDPTVNIALRRLERMPQGPSPDTVASPFPIVDAPYAEQELTLGDTKNFIWELLPFSLPFKSVLVSAFKIDVERHIRGGTRNTSKPVIVDAPEGLLIYRGLDIAIAQLLLGEAELWVTVVPAPGTLTDEPYLPIRWR